MATFGSFAAPPSPSPLTNINPLQDLISGLQQGIQLRQLPQQLADQELQKRLNNALLAQKLADLQNPEAALTRKLTEELALKGALNPDLGIQKAPPGLTGETIYNPQAIPFTGNQLEQALKETVGMAVPTAAPLQPTTPIAPFGIQTGLNLNPNAPIQAAERDLTQELVKEQKKSDIVQARQIEVDKQKEQNKAKTPAKITAKKEGNFIVKRDSQTGEKVGEPEPIPEGSHFVNIPNVGAGYVNENTEKFTPIDGTQPTPTSAGIKPTGEESRAFRNTVNVFSTLDDVEKKADELAKTGKYPGGVQTFINQFLTSRPDDIPGAGLIPGAAAIYSVAQQRLRDAQTPESRQLEAMRAELTANIIRAQAGLSQTSGEIANVTPYTPQINDTIESLRDKIANLRIISERDLNSFQMVYPAFRDVEIPGFKQGSSPNSSNPIVDVPTRGNKVGRFTVLPPE